MFQMRPYNYILYPCGFILILIYPVYLCAKRKKQREMIKYVVDLVHCRTFGIIRVECIYGIQGFHAGRRIGRNRRRGLQQLIVRIMHGQLHQYNMRQVNRPFNGNVGNNYDFQNGLNEPFMNNHYNGRRDGNQGHYDIGNNQMYNRNNPPQYPY